MTCFLDMMSKISHLAAESSILDTLQVLTHTRKGADRSPFAFTSAAVHESPPTGSAVSFGLCEPFVRNRVHTRCEVESRSTGVQDRVPRQELVSVRARAAFARRCDDGSRSPVLRVLHRCNPLAHHNSIGTSASELAASIARYSGRVSKPVEFGRRNSLRRKAPENGIARDESRGPRERERNRTFSARRTAPQLPSLVPR